jgi:hypothetical protein
MRLVEARAVAARRILALAPLVSLILLLAGCSGGSSSGSGDAADLRRAQTRWARAGVRDYAYTVRVSAFAPGVQRPARITVQNGRAISITPGDDEPIPLENNGQIFAAYDTVEDLFAVIQRAIDTRADSLNVDYDPVLGYPTRITIDYIRLAADDELGIQVSQFEAAR